MGFPSPMKIRAIQEPPRIICTLLFTSILHQNWVCWTDNFTTSYEQVMNKLLTIMPGRLPGHFPGFCSSFAPVSVSKYGKCYCGTKWHICHFGSLQTGDIIMTDMTESDIEQALD